MFAFACFPDGPRSSQHLAAVLIRLEHHCPTVVFLVCVLGFCCFSFLLLRVVHAHGQLQGLCKGPHMLSFVAIHCDGVACFAQLTAGKYKLVGRPGESHRGVGRRKKKYFFSLFPIQTEDDLEKLGEL